MRHAGIAPLLLILPLVAAAPPSVGSSWSPVEQVEDTTPRRLIVKGKPQTYFRVGPRRPIRFTVQGPGSLKVVSRATLPAGSSRSVVYSIRVLGAHAPLEAHSIESNPEPGVRPADGAPARLCESKTFTVPLPAGGTPVWISATGTLAAYVRLFFTASRHEGTDWVAVVPWAAFRTVTVSEGDRWIPYSSVAHGKPVQLQVMGPARLELTVRLDYDATMRGPQSYALAVSSAQRTLRELRLRTTRSASASYTDLKDRVPSEPDRVEIPLGPGLQQITVDLVAPPSGTAEIHARLTSSTGSE